jgi:hypothetical protein
VTMEARVAAVSPGALRAKSLEVGRKGAIRPPARWAAPASSHELPETGHGSDFAVRGAMSRGKS